MGPTLQLTRAIIAVILSAVLSACSTSVGTVQTSPPSPALHGDAAAAAKAKADSARYPYTDADISFMSGMIWHHAQAIVMAGWAPTHGASPSVRTLSERRITAQQDEIASMQLWLKDRHQPVPDARANGMKMMMNGVEHEMMMPGMLSDAQMQQLNDATGAEFDRLFLTFMIQHHQGALTMVDDLFASVGAGQELYVFRFASDVGADQTTEIDRMRTMLHAPPLQRNQP